MAEEQLTPKRGRPAGSKDMVPRKRREDLAKFGQENIEPGDNTRFIRHALATMNMPPIDISDPVQVDERINWYFNHCMDSDMKPTVNGLCNSLGITRETLRNWKSGEYRGKGHQDVVRQAYKMLEELWEDYMMNGKINPVSGIFLAKNMFEGYYDKQEYVLTPNTGAVEAVDAASIEAKYAELPED